jgi:2,3-bisphosphoglycerate-dependent phosphoglycerate mutase
MLFLVRHAHSEYSPDNTRGLSEQGRQASLRVADLLQAHDIAAIISSPYARAIQTVQPLADRLKMVITVDSDLRERRLSSGPLDDFERSLEATWRDFDLVHPGGESSAAAQVRVSRAIRRIATIGNGRNVVVATHGNALALFLHTLDRQVDFSFWTRLSLPDVYAVATEPAGAWSFRRVWSPLETFGSVAS